jgi:hypothetical protein
MTSILKRLSQVEGLLVATVAPDVGWFLNKQCNVLWALGLLKHFY